MKILHIITGLGDGGAESVLYRLCASDQKNIIHVCSMMDEGKYGSRLIDIGVQCHYLKMPRGRITFSGLRKLYIILKEQNPDVVQTWMYHADLVGGIMSKIAGIKNIYWGIRHSNLDKETNKLSTILIARICSLFSSFIPKKIVSCSYAGKKIHESIGYKSNKFIVIHNGYNYKKFVYLPESGRLYKKELILNKDDILLGFVARFNTQKDHQNLIHAISILQEKYKHLTLLLVGSGMTKDNKEVNHMLRNYNVNHCVKLLGSREDIPEIMNALDIHVMSSSSEGFPNVLAEAMVCGTPCVTTNVGDAAYIVNSTGWVVPPKSPQELANALFEAIMELSNKDKWQRRQESCRKRIINYFSLEKMCSIYQKTWNP